MRKRIQLISFLILAIGQLHAAIIHVDSTQTTNIPTGESWQVAFNDLQGALAIALNGDQIWVAQGTYYPSEDDKTISFILPSGVQLLGGFQGVETTIEERNWETYPTHLSGNIHDPNQFFNNTQHILRIENVDTTTLIDGFTIAGGFANFWLPQMEENHVGAAIFHTLGNASKAKLTLLNCIFRENIATIFTTNNNLDEGGGVIYNKADGGHLEIELDNCEFVENDGHYKVMNNWAVGANDTVTLWMKNSVMQEMIGTNGNHDLFKLEGHQGVLNVHFEEVDIINVETGIFDCLGDSARYTFTLNEVYADSILKNPFQRFLQVKGTNNMLYVNIKNSELKNLDGRGISAGADNLIFAKIRIDDCSFSNYHGAFIGIQNSDSLDIALNHVGVTNQNNNGSWLNVSRSIIKTKVLIKNSIFQDVFSSTGSNRLITLIDENVLDNILIDSCIFRNINFSNNGDILQLRAKDNNLIVQNCNFTNNSGRDIWLFQDGSFLNAGSIVIDNCQFTNTDIASNLDMAISTEHFFTFDTLQPPHNIKVRNSKFYDKYSNANNTSTIYLENTNANIENCLFAGINNDPNSIIHLNQQYSTDTTTATLTNCTFANNTGSAIFNNSSQLTLQNCIIDGQALTTSDAFFTPSNTIQSSLFTQSNCPPDYTFCTDNLWASDPVFIAPDSADYRLQACSPASNAGNNALAPSGSQDLQGEARIIDAIIDMGAYETPQMSIDIATQSPDYCGGVADGSATLAVSDFCAPLTIDWENGTTNSTSFSGLAAGNYPLSLTDARGRVAFFDLLIADTLSLVLDTTILQADCATSTAGSILTDISGGIPPYNLVWNTGDTTAELTNVLSGTYQLAIVDSVGCTDSLNIAMQATGTIPVAFDVQPITCHDATDGTITLFTEGGFEPLTYSWSDGTMEATLQDVGAGSYEGYIADTVGCFGAGTIILDNPTIINASATITDSDTPSSNNGSIMITNIMGGTPPYDIEWNTGETSEMLSNLAMGDYLLTISDSLGCMQQFNYTIDILNSVSNTIDISTVLFPNPVAANTWVYYQNESTNMTHYEWRTMNGILIQRAILPNDGAIPTPMLSGLYLLELQNKQGIKGIVKVAVFNE